MEGEKMNGIEVHNVKLKRIKEKVKERKEGRKTVRKEERKTDTVSYEGPTVLGLVIKVWRFGFHFCLPIYSQTDQQSPGIDKWQ